jgi:hypothetical protein
MPGISDLGKMPKDKILQKYRTKIIELGGPEELKFVKEQFSVRQLREYIEDFFAPGPDGKYKKGGVASKKYNKGGALKKAPSGNKGVKKLPTAVRNKMGYMSKGGTAKKKTK